MSRKKKGLSENQLLKIGSIFTNERKKYEKKYGETSYRKFSDIVGVSHSTIQTIEAGKLEPSLSVINAYRKQFGGTISYWLGENTCKELKNEEMHRMTGMSENAINKLKSYKNFIDNKKDYLQENYFKCLKRIQVINYLIETLEDVIENSGIDLTKKENDNCLIDNIYSYLFADFDTHAEPEKYEYDEISKIGNYNHNKGCLLQKSDLRMAKLLGIQKNLIEMQRAEEIKRAIEKSEQEK